MIFVILNLNIEDYVLRECIFYLEVYLESLIKLCRLLNYFDRVPLIDVGNQFENHSGSLDVAFLFIGENYFAFYLSGNARLESYRESNALTRLDLYLFLLD